MLKPFQRDSSEPYTVEAEIENFFADFYEWNRAMSKCAAKSDSPPPFRLAQG